MKDRDQHLIWEAYEQLNESLSKEDVRQAIIGAWTKSEGDWDTLLDYLGTTRETTDHQTWLAATGDIFRMHRDEVPQELFKALSLMDQASEPVSDVPSINKADSDAPSTTDPSMKKANTAFDIGVWVETLLRRHLTKWEPDDYAYLTDVITALANNKFEPKEPWEHYAEEGDEWLLGDETEALEYAKVIFTTRSDDWGKIDPKDKLVATYADKGIDLNLHDEEKHLVALFNTNAVVDADMRQSDRYDLNNIQQVNRLIRAINEAGIEINNE